MSKDSPAEPALSKEDIEKIAEYFKLLAKIDKSLDKIPSD